MPPDTAPAAPAQQPAAPAERVIANSDSQAADLMSRFIAPPPAEPEGRRDERGRFRPSQPPAEEAPAEQNASADEQATEQEGEQQDADGEGKAPETIEIDPEAPLFEVKVKQPGGEDEARKVSLKDLKSGYMMQADYQRKTAELAHERRTVAKSAQDAVEAERNQYRSALTQLQEFVVRAAAPDLANVDWAKLATESPADYVRLMARREQVQQALQAVAQQHNGMTQKQAKEAESKRAQAAEESVKALRESIPAWNDDLYQSLMRAAVKDYGYQPDEVAQAVDHRFFKLLNDANAYRALQDGKQLVDKKVAEVPKIAQKANGARQPVQNAQVKQIQQARQRLKTDNSIDAAADAMAAFIGGQRR